MRATAALLGALAGAAAAATPAAAQVVVTEAPPADRPNFRSPQRWAFELRFGPYSPNVDDEFDGAAKPHEEFFGSSPRLMTQVELDYQFFDRFGTAAVGAQIGYFREKARAFFEPEPGGRVEKRSGDDTKLSLVPMAALLVYRMDVAARKWTFPLVPYAKVGLNYTLWSVFDGNGNVAKLDGDAGRGRGGTLGWQAAVGLSFLLDVIEPGSARELDGEIGVNHTYLFVELNHVAADGFGREGRLNVGDTTWAAGLLFEF